jgi:hypothetical protein
MHFALILGAKKFCSTPWTPLPITLYCNCCLKYVTFLFVIKQTRCTNFSKLFWNETPHVSDNSSVHRQELFTVHSAMVCEYVIQTAFEQQDQDETS